MAFSACVSGWASLHFRMDATNGASRRRKPTSATLGRLTLMDESGGTIVYHDEEGFLMLGSTLLRNPPFTLRAVDAAFVS